MRNLTNQHMLTAAKRALAQHRSMRPATPAEAAAIAADYRSKEVSALAAAEELSGTPWPEDSVRAARLRNDALAYRLHAESWERVAAAPEGEAYRATEAELIARVEYYARLVG